MKSQKQNRHSLMAKGIMVLLSLLIMIFVISYAWFTDKPQVYTTGITGMVESSSVDFQVAVGFETESTDSYKVTQFQDRESGGYDFEHLRVTNANTAQGYDEYNLLEYYNPVDLTSDGITLIRPAMLSKNRDIDTSKNTYDYAEPNVQYITFDLIARSQTRNAVISLDDGSKVLSAIESTLGNVNPSLLVGSNVDRVSSYGNFSEDSVVGAVRLSFVDMTSVDTMADINSSNDIDLNTDELEFIWVPRSDIFLQATNNESGWVLYKSGDSQWTSNTAAPPGGGTALTYSELAKKHYYYQIFETDGNHPHTYTTSSKAVTDLTAAQNIITCSIDNTSSDGYYYGKCRVNIWIDGCDAEARRAIVNGQFRIVFSLTS